MPPKCTDEGNVCLLHVHFHGCVMCAEMIGTDFILESGLLELADANDVVIVFPQAIADYLVGNPNCCFDWFQYTNPSGAGDPFYYATREAPQMDAVYQMIVRAARL